MNFHKIFVTFDNASSNSTRKASEDKYFIYKTFVKCFMYSIILEKSAVIENKSNRYRE